MGPVRLVLCVIWAWHGAWCLSVVWVWVPVLDLGVFRGVCDLGVFLFVAGELSPDFGFHVS